MIRHPAISGQFILSAGAFAAVILSFATAASVIGPDGPFIHVIVLFLIFFAALFIPLSLLTRPRIEREALRTYLDGIEKKIKRWRFREEDLTNLRRIETLLTKKRGRRDLTTLARIAFLISEIERLEGARASFFWEDAEGTKH